MPTPTIKVWGHWPVGSEQPDYLELLKRRPDLAPAAAPTIAPWSYELQRRMQTVNSLVNQSINYHRNDTPFDGWLEDTNCSGYAKAKLIILKALGVPRGALRLTLANIGKGANNQNHAVLMVDTSEGTWILDNRVAYPYMAGTRDDITPVAREGAGGPWEILRDPTPVLSPSS